MSLPTGPMPYPEVLRNLAKFRALYQKGGEPAFRTTEYYRWVQEMSAEDFYVLTYVAGRFIMERPMDTKSLAPEVWGQVLDRLGLAITYAAEARALGIVDLLITAPLCQMYVTLPFGTELPQVL